MDQNTKVNGYSPLSSYLSLFKEYKGKTVVAFIFFLIKIIPVWLTPIIVSNIINELTEGRPGATKRILIQFGIGFFFIFQNVFTHVIFVRVFSQIVRSIEKELRLNLCRRLQNLTIAYHTNNKIGSLQTKVLRDVENVEMLSRMLMETVPNIAFSMGTAIVVTLIRAPQFILFYIVLVPIAVLVFWSVRSGMKKSNQQFRANVEEMSGKIIEMLRLISITRAHNMENDELNRVGHKLEKVKESGLKLDFINSIFGAINWVLFSIFNLITLATAAVLSHEGIIPLKIGDIILLTTYFSIITNSVMGILNVFPNLTKGLESVNSIDEVMGSNECEQKGPKRTLESLEGEFHFNDVTYSYPDSLVPAVEHLSLKVEKGETIAFVGPSGSGKSTIMQLIIGFIKADSGFILLDNHNMKDIDLKSYRKHISVVSQETILFDGSIKDNITYCRNIPEEKVMKAVEDANLSDFIADLPEGLDSGVKENGARLSGGQRQRMAIARALIRDPKVLVLDEATSALDVESEAQIQEALNRLISGRTTFIVAHRLSTIRNADRIVVLEKGRIVESGTHEELLKLKGAYYKMRKIQIGDDAED